MIKTLSNSMRKALDEIKDSLANEKIQTVEMLDTYRRVATGKEVSKEEMEAANTQIVDVIRGAGLSILIILPGSVITIPFLVKTARKYNIELLPDSFIKDD